MPRFGAWKMEVIMERIMSEELLENYKRYLEDEEKSPATIDKYIRDNRKIMKYAEGTLLTKPLLLAFKEKLYKTDGYKVNSANSILESVNRFFEFMEWYELRVKTYRTQQETFCLEERHLTKKEYKKLLAEARKQGKQRLYLIMETLASTGMRVSELQFATVEAARVGILEVDNKGKIRKVLLTKQMRSQLLSYAKDQGIEEGYLFRTRSGRPVDRSNVWKEMKSLCEGAGVDPRKVFPHNLRKLFAASLYQMEKDIAKLADLLGHSSIETTRRYIRETSREHRRTLERLNLVGAAWY